MAGANEASVQFSLLAGNYIRLWLLIANIRYVLNLGLNRSQKTLKEIHLQGFERFLEDPALAEIVSAVGKDQIRTIIDDSFIEQTVESSLNQAQISVDAASIVFAHSLLDAFLFDLLKLSTRTDSDVWDKYLNNKKVTFEDVRNKGTTIVRGELRDKCLAALEKESLLTKCNRLLEICSPPSGAHPVQNYVFDQSKLRDLDELRHDVVHGLKIDMSIADIEEKLDYLKTTGKFFLALIKDRFNLKPIAPSIIKGLLQTNIEIKVEEKKDQ